MPLPIHRAGLRKKKRLHRFVQPGINRVDFATGRTDDQARESEDIRRRFIPIEEPEPVEDFGGGGGGGNQGPIIPPPVTQAVPDREHFWGNHFVLFSNDHRQGEDKPVAPGYAPLGSASTLQGALTKAEALVAKLSNNGRIVIIMKGGYIEESVTFNNPRIDLEGEGSPFIVGNTVIGPLATTMKIRNFRFLSENENPALEVVATPSLPPFRPTLPTIELHDCEMVGGPKAFVTSRRVFCLNSIFKATGAAVFGDETGTVTVKAQVEPSGPSVFDGCYFYAREDETKEFEGYAIVATAKVATFTTTLGGYIEGSAADLTADGKYMLSTGVILKDCFVSGGLLNEGWQVHHIGGWQRCGAFFPPASGHVYCRMRGWRKIEDGLGATTAIQAYTYWNNTVTYASAIAEFIRDPNFTPDYPIGGVARYLNSLHKNKFNTGTSASAFHNNGSTGIVHIGHSMTASPEWVGSAIEPNIVASPKGSDYGIDVMREMMADQLVYL